MKTVLLFGTLFILGSATLFGQVDMTINGVSVSTGQVFNYTAQTVMGSFDFEEMELSIDNLASSTVDLEVERCKIIDVPGWEINSTIWLEGSDPFGGIHFSPATMTGTCWITQVGPVTATASGDSAVFVDYLESTDISCALYRYYIWGDGQILDSVDVEYCRTGTNSLQENSSYGVQLYPNPTNERVYIGHDASIFEVHIYNVYGELVLSQPASDAITDVDVSTLEDGVYFAELHGSFNERKQIRFVVTR